MKTIHQSQGAGHLSDREDIRSQQTIQLKYVKASTDMGFRLSIHYARYRLVRGGSHNSLPFVAKSSSNPIMQQSISQQWHGFRPVIKRARNCTEYIPCTFTPQVDPHARRLAGRSWGSSNANTIITWDGRGFDSTSGLRIQIKQHTT